MVWHVVFEQGIYGHIIKKHQTVGVPLMTTPSMDGKDVEWTWMFRKHKGASEIVTSSHGARVYSRQPKTMNLCDSDAYFTKVWLFDFCWDVANDCQCMKFISNCKLLHNRGQDLVSKWNHCMGCDWKQVWRLGCPACIYPRKRMLCLCCPSSGRKRHIVYHLQVSMVLSKITLYYGLRSPLLLVNYIPWSILHFILYSIPPYARQRDKVYSEDRVRCKRVASQLKSGVVWENCSQAGNQGCAGWLQLQVTGVGQEDGSLCSACCHSCRSEPLRCCFPRPLSVAGRLCEPWAVLVATVEIVESLFKSTVLDLVATCICIYIY